MDYVGLFRSLLGQGWSREDALGELHRIGASPIWCIRAVHEVERIGLAAAKEAVAQSPSWSEYIRRNDDSLIAGLKKMETEGEHRS
jgi:hypothetical protein